MTDKQNNRIEDKIFAIEQISPKGLFEAVTKQNEQIQRYKQIIKDVEHLAIHLRERCGQVVPIEVKQIIQKCEVNNG